MVKIGSTIFTMDMLQKSKEPKDQEPEKDTEKELNLTMVVWPTLPAVELA